MKLPIEGFARDGYYERSIVVSYTDAGEIKNETTTVGDALELLCKCSPTKGGAVVREPSDPFVPLGIEHIRAIRQGLSAHCKRSLFELTFAPDEARHAVLVFSVFRSEMVQSLERVCQFANARVRDLESMIGEWAAPSGVR